MRVIEQKTEENLTVEIFEDGTLSLMDIFDNVTWLDKQGAKQLIEVLKEFIEDD